MTKKLVHYFLKIKGDIPYKLYRRNVFNISNCPLFMFFFEFLVSFILPIFYNYTCSDFSFQQSIYQYIYIIITLAGVAAYFPGYNPWYMLANSEHIPDMLTNSTQCRLVKISWLN
jgi:hypothetical protein